MSFIKQWKMPDGTTYDIKSQVVTPYVSTSDNNLNCLKNIFSSIPKSEATAVRLQHGSHSMALGWFLSGYDFDHAYGGWFISDYGTPSWVGVDNGTWNTAAFLTNNNYPSYLDGRYVNVTGDTMTGPLAVINDSSNSGYDALGYFKHCSNNDWGIIVEKNDSYDYGIDIRTSGSYGLRVGGYTRLRGATTIGADASPSYTLDVRGNTRSTGRIYSNEWIEFSGGSGLYWPNTHNSTHFYPNDCTTYGNLLIRGSKGGYAGIQLGPNTGYMEIMDNGTDKGLYQQSQRWLLYYNSSSQRISLMDSSTSYGLSIQLNGTCGITGKTYIGTTSGSEMLNVGGWVGTTGTGGWYSITYGGGIYMEDSTWVRTYNNKSFYCSNTIGCASLYSDGNLRVSGVSNLNGGVSFPNNVGISALMGGGSDGWSLCGTGESDNGVLKLIVRDNATSDWFYFQFDDWSGSSYTPMRITGNQIRCDAPLYGAVWNDYAEYRESEILEPGRVVMEKGDDTLILTEQRLSPFAGVISDTFGISQGETETAKTPIAVAGRVLVYTYKDKNLYQPGDCVCSAPNGTVDIMTREEVEKYPDRLIGTVSCVPTYEIWGTNKIMVNNRIWIKVK